MKILLASMLLLSACGGADATLPVDNVIVSAALANKLNKAITNKTYIQYSIESSNSQVGINTEQFRILKNQTDLDNLLAQTTLMGNPPVANFSTEQLIAIFVSKTINTCATKITIDSVTQQSDSVFVFINKFVPGKTDKNRPCSTKYLDNKPYIIIKTARVDKPVSLIYSVSKY